MVANVTLLGCFLMAHCVLVKGPCRGKMCDFWARIKIQKKSIDEMADDIRESIAECEEGNIKTITEVIQAYWSALGVRDMNRLCEEESNLYEKIKQVEYLALEQNSIKAIQIPQAQQ